MARDSVSKSPVSTLPVVEEAGAELTADGSAGLLVFAGQRLVSHRLPHSAPLTIRSTRPLQDFGNKVKYFEVTILSVAPGGEGITVGLSPGRRGGGSGHEMLGHARHSVGWSSCGVLYTGAPNTAQRFGAHTGGGSKFSAGDVIGCGFDESSKDLFFTRNGMRISGESHLRAFTKDISLRGYPAVCLSSPYDAILLNFDGHYSYHETGLVGFGNTKPPVRQPNGLLLGSGMKTLSNDRVFVRVQKPVKRASRQLTHGEPVAGMTQTATSTGAMLQTDKTQSLGMLGVTEEQHFKTRPDPQQCRIPPELLKGASVAGGDVMYFEVAVLRAERDAPGRSFAEYPDVTVGVRSAGMSDADNGGSGGGAELQSVTLRGQEGLVCCGSEVRSPSLCLG